MMSASGDFGNLTGNFYPFLAEKNHTITYFHSFFLTMVMYSSFHQPSIVLIKAIIFYLK